MRRKYVQMMGIILSTAMVITPIAGAMPGNVKTVEAADQSVQKQFYVAVDGDDANDGTKEHPFATVERARQEVDKINDDMTGDIVVNIAGGDYYLEDTVTFGPEDSGTNGHEVIYRSSDGNGKANLIGGEEIEGWTLADETDVQQYDLDEELLGKVYKVQLDKEQYDFNTLYVNDERAVMARTRNRDNNPNFPMARGEYMRSTGGWNKDHNMLFNLADLDEKSLRGMTHAQERGEKEIAQVVVWDGGDWDWFTNTLPVESIQGNEMKFPVDPERVDQYLTRYDIQSGARFFLQGNLAFMDVEGEYHYNKSTGVLYYYPQEEDGAIEDQTIIVPTMQKVLYFKGADKENLADEPNPEEQVHNITIDGLTVKDTEFDDYYTYSWNPNDTSLKYDFPKESLESTNPTYCTTVDRPEFREGSIMLTGTHDITITNTRVKNSGMYGVSYEGDNQNNLLENSVIENSGYGGVLFQGGYPAIGKYNNHNKVENVLIHDVGELVGHAIGLTVMSSGQNEFTNLEIFNTPKRAMLIIGGYAFYDGVDKNYDPIKDMYTVGNHFQYIHVHDAQQDAGEDSAIFLSWLLAGKDIQRMHGSNDPNNLTMNLDGIDLSIDRYNYFDQMLITDIGADPSVIEKCTVGGLDTAMGASGTQFSNIQAANTQHHLLAIRPGSYGDMYNYENCTNNVQNVTENEELKTFDNSKMEYDKIGLTASFPEEYRVAKKEYPEAPENLYFGDDFEASRNLDLRKWNVEKGNMEMHHGYGYMSENPKVGRRSLPIDADNNPNGIVVSRNFDNELNKIVEVKYLDRRKDYARNDAVDSGVTGILPNSFLRVDDGEHALGLGAVGAESKDYYFIKKGNELIKTDVKRYFGWHTFEFDYSSGTDVKLYIDDQLVATYDESDGVATSFSYIGMGDWEGKGGKAFFDQLYVYGGQDAPPVEDLPLPTPPEQPEEALFQENFESENPTEFAQGIGSATVEVGQDPANENNKVMHVTSPGDMVYYKTDEEWKNYTFESRIWIDNWDVNEQAQPWDHVAPAWNIGEEDGKGNFNRYSLKFLRETNEFALYRRIPGNDLDMIKASGPDDYLGKWHDYKITYTDGLMEMYIDGGKVLEYTDTSNPSGSIGFDGNNAEYYVDDIKVTRQKTANPSADKEAGTYKEAINVQLIPASEGQDIFYTLDGSNPTDPEHGQYYVPGELLFIDKTTTVKFAAIMDGALYSDVVEKTYTIEDAGEVVDKSALQALYDANKDKTNDNYTDASWSTFQNALEKAADVLADENATQLQIDEATAELQAAIDGLEQKEEPSEADKTLLQKTYDYALTLSTDGVTDSAKAFFEKAMTEAQAVLDNPKATQDEVNAAWDQLLEGIWRLGIVKGDKKNLELLIDRADAMLAEADRYVQDNWQQLVDALAAAKGVYNSGDSTQDIVDETAENLLNAILAQRYKANKDNLKDLIDKANGLDLSKYTEKSVKALKKALAKANDIYADDSLSVDDQKKVNKAADELKAAIDGLKLASDDGNNNNNGSGNGSDNGNNDGTPSDGDKDVKKDAPKTGDAMDVALWTMLMAAIAGIAVVEAKRRRR